MEPGWRPLLQIAQFARPATGLLLASACLSLEHENPQPVARLGGEATGQLVAVLAQADFQGVAVERKDCMFPPAVGTPVERTEGDLIGRLRQVELEERFSFHADFRPMGDLVPFDHPDKLGLLDERLGQLPTVGFDCDQRPSPLNGLQFPLVAVRFRRRRGARVGLRPLALGLLLCGVLCGPLLLCRGPRGLDRKSVV